MRYNMDDKMYVTITLHEYRDLIEKSVMPLESLRAEMSENERLEKELYYAYKTSENFGRLSMEQKDRYAELESRFVCRFAAKNLDKEETEAEE